MLVGRVWPVYHCSLVVFCVWSSLIGQFALKGFYYHYLSVFSFCLWCTTVHSAVQLLCCCTCPNQISFIAQFLNFWFTRIVDCWSALNDDFSLRRGSHASIGSVTSALVFSLRAQKLVVHFIWPARCNEAQPKIYFHFLDDYFLLWCSQFSY